MKKPSILKVRKILYVICVRSAAERAARSDVRTIGIVRARAKIGLQNLAYNIRRLVTLERMAAA